MHKDLFPQLLLDARLPGERGCFVSGHLEVDIEWIGRPPADFDGFDGSDWSTATSWRVHALTHRPVSWLMPSFLQASLPAQLLSVVLHFKRPSMGCPSYL